MQYCHRHSRAGFVFVTLSIGVTSLLRFIYTDHFA